MLKEYEQSKEIIENIIKNIPDSIKGDELKLFTYVYVKVAGLLSYDDYAKRIIESDLVGFDKERAYDFVVEPACDIRCLNSKKALSEGFSNVLIAILNELNIKSEKINCNNHYYNQVCINGNWYNCDLTKDYSLINNGELPRYFLTSDYDLKVIPFNKKHICKDEIFDNETGIQEKKKLIKETKELIEKVREKEIEDKTKKVLEGKIYTEDIFVACKIITEDIVLKPFINHKSYNQTYKNVIIDPKRVLVIRLKIDNEYVYKLIPSLEEIKLIHYKHSYYIKDGNKENSKLNNEIEYGYLVTFKDYIKRKMDLNIDAISLHDARVLNTFTNLVSGKKFMLSSAKEKAEEQLDEKVYLKKKNK